MLKATLGNLYLRHACVLDNDVIVVGSSLSAYTRLMCGHGKILACNRTVRWSDKKGSFQIGNIYLKIKYLHNKLSLHKGVVHIHFSGYEVFGRTPVLLLVLLTVMFALPPTLTLGKRSNIFPLRCYSLSLSLKLACVACRNFIEIIK